MERILGYRHELINGMSVRVVDQCMDVPLLKSQQLLLETGVVIEQVRNHDYYIVRHL